MVLRGPRYHCLDMRAELRRKAKKGLVATTANPTKILVEKKLRTPSGRQRPLQGLSAHEPQLNARTRASDSRVSILKWRLISVAAWHRAPDSWQTLHSDTLSQVCHLGEGPHHVHSRTRRQLFIRPFCSAKNSGQPGAMFMAEIRYSIKLRLTRMGSSQGQVVLRHD